MPRQSAKWWRCPKKSFQLPVCALAGPPRRAASPLVYHWIQQSMKNASRMSTWVRKSMHTTGGVRPGAHIEIKERSSVSAAANFTAGRKTKHGNMPFPCALILALSCEQRASVWIDQAMLFFANAESQNTIRFRFFFKRITGLTQEIRNINAGQRIGTLRYNQVARTQRGQFLAHS